MYEYLYAPVISLFLQLLRFCLNAFLPPHALPFIVALKMLDLLPTVRTYHFAIHRETCLTG